MEMIVWVAPLVAVLLVACGCSATQTQNLQVLQDPHTRNMKQAAFGPAVDMINDAAYDASGMIRDASGGVVNPGYYVNASDGTLTGNGNVDLKTPLSRTCCNFTAAFSDGIINGTAYAYEQSGQIFPVPLPNLPGDVVRIGNASAGVAVGQAVNGAQATTFAGDHMDNETSTLETDRFAFSGQLKPNTPVTGYDMGSSEFGFAYSGGNVSDLYTGTGTPVNNGA
eukprot:jgi/Botrbrau1/5798/Bobra.0155s0021.1